MWSRLDDGLFDHYKIAAAARQIGGKHARYVALGFFAQALGWCNRHLSDGVVPIAVVDSWGTDARLLADAMRRAGLFERHKLGYQIHDFAEYNHTAAQVRKRRADRHLQRGNGRA